MTNTNTPIYAREEQNTRGYLQFWLLLEEIRLWLRKWDTFFTDLILQAKILFCAYSTQLTIRLQSVEQYTQSYTKRLDVTFTKAYEIFALHKCFPTSSYKPTSSRKATNQGRCNQAIVPFEMFKNMFIWWVQQQVILFFASSQMVQVRIILPPLKISDGFRPVITAFGSFITTVFVLFSDVHFIQLFYPLASKCLMLFTNFRFSSTM